MCVRVCVCVGGGGGGDSVDSSQLISKDGGCSFKTSKIKDIKPQLVDGGKGKLGNGSVATLIL